MGTISPRNCTTDGWLALAGLDLGQLAVCADIVAPCGKRLRLRSPFRNRGTDLGSDRHPVAKLSLARRAVEKVLDRVFVVIDG